MPAVPTTYGKHFHVHGLIRARGTSTSGQQGTEYIPPHIYSNIPVLWAIKAAKRVQVVCIIMCVRYLHVMCTMHVCNTSDYIMEGGFTT